MNASIGWYSNHRFDENWGDPQWVRATVQPGKQLVNSVKPYRRQAAQRRPQYKCQLLSVRHEAVG